MTIIIIYGLVADFCKHGNELSDPIKGEAFVDG
jgi:hypothetical protein